MDHRIEKTETELQSLPLFAHAQESSLSVDLVFEEPKPKHWTISELTKQIRGILEPTFDEIWVQGEISNYRPAASGHLYFSLKDEGACIAAAVFRWGSRKRAFELKEGLQVLCRGKISVYPPRGTYQLVIDQIEPLGAGALQLAFEQLKTRLSAEGLFDSAVKRSLPAFPSRIAVVTSPTGAAIQDMLTILRRRAPQIEVLVVPAVVQGEDAPQHLIRAIEAVNRHSLGEVVVLARGGGSIEDLWCFNHEGLARAIRRSQVPVVSAVGHEIDFTISDFAADLRAPTPSAAAEILSGHWVEAVGLFRQAKDRLKTGMVKDLMNRKRAFEQIASRLISPKDRLREQGQFVDDLSARLERAIRNQLERKQALFDRSVGKMDALSPLRVLERGYSLARNPKKEGKVIRSAREIQPGDVFEITFYDGQQPVQAL